MKVCISKRFLIIWFLILLLIPTITFCQGTVEQRLGRIEADIDTLLSLHRTQLNKSDTYEIIKDTLNLLYGIASSRGTILDKGYFVINHNDNWKIPYWVAYRLTSSDLEGNAKRTDDFRHDPELPVGSRAELEDYRNSGYDRGHNAPAADFNRSRDAMSTTFLLSNMSPQTPALNRNIWEKLEEQVRALVTEEGKAWIVTGNLFLSTDSQFVSPVEYVGANKVAVPTHCFKAILSVGENGGFSMYAFILPNQRDNIPGKPADYMITVDRLEGITGYDFFPELNDSIENKLESKMPSTWPR